MSASYRVLVADAIAADGLAPLRDDARFELIVRPGLAGGELADAIAGADAVLVRSATKITKESLERAERLKVIGRAGVGVDTIDVDAATARGIAVLTAPSGNTISAAELTFALLLALVRRVAAADRSMKSGEWDKKSFSGTELYGKTLGLVGAGRIGSEVAKRARAFGMRVLCYDPYVTEERAQTLEVELVSLDDLVARSDVVTLHIPLTDATTGLLSEERLRRMRKGAMVVNAARGGLIDEPALVRLLEQKHLGGAALDVFEQEPLPADHPLRRIPTVVLTPHLGASTAEAQQNVALEIAEAVRAALVDGDLSRAVNAPSLGGEEMRRLAPLLSLAERLGRLAATLAPGPVRRVEVRYAGEAENNPLNPIAASAMVGVLATAVGARTVNFVNALHLAETRGIHLDRMRLDSHSAYAEYVELRLSGRNFETCVAGALLSDVHPRVVRIDAHHVDVVPRGALIVIRNRDVPGVIGRVGTLLGEARINIAGYHQSRLEAGHEALAAISVDEVVSSEVLEKLRAVPDVIEVRQVQLN
ncbi:MAG TPA: phosphoglycerate dehydrogenase [Gemmatimonadaceae bacterium]|nr:phosphoglycerate dehydrogenase [Gemmatimonadaceae bacterium]